MITLSDIIKVIEGNIKFCFCNDRAFFVAGCEINNNTIKFIDVVDGVEYKESLDNIELVTFGDNTIPLARDLADTESFFKIYANDHKQSNLVFENLVSECNRYIEAFNKKDSLKIKKAVLGNNTNTLDNLVFLGMERVIDIKNCNYYEAANLKSAYLRLVNKKLNETLSYLNEHISASVDEDFKHEAIMIKDDLINNVSEFEKLYDTLDLSTIFSCWPTLLNPSPFRLNNEISSTCK